LSLLRRYLPLATLFLAVATFYLYNLNGTGLLGPDEPRYAAIGQAMAHTGDWITPRLWGSDWFEKPPLLYWLTAAGTLIGLGAETSARLPVAVMSLAFLGVFFRLAALEFGAIAAGLATAGLATSASWIVFSNLALTDLPLACFFSLAIVVLLPMLRPGASSSRMRWLVSGACLGAAALAKGLVPLVLILPVAWFFRRYWRQWWLAAASFFVVALPWYGLVYARNGWPFVQEFFLKHHLERLYSNSLQHVQPWYFYFPVLLGALFPWTPLLGILARRFPWDERRRFLLATAVFGFVFFSISLNKLPGYLLPLIPAVFLLIGSAFHSLPAKRWLLACAVLIAFIPLFAQALPALLSAGRIIAFRPGSVSATEVFYIAVPLATVLLARRSWAPILLVLCIVADGFFVKVTTYPLLDGRVSARVLWRQEIQPIQNEVCEEWIKRDWVYGLSFYRGALIPSCYNMTYRFHLMPKARVWPVVEDRKR
jgi:4-amino-4-deoxy-L-arabinose transferase-like glycosyltransferase